QIFKDKGIRTSIFVDTNPKMIEGAALTGTDRVELYTESYAKTYEKDNKKAVQSFAEAAKIAHELGLGVNAGHDLSLDNIKYFKQNVPYLLEVSIGHALICESLYLGMENVINMYLNLLK
ncbi:MAG: pyridoxine 5'-phosphate synthase, partial [Bacteroidota bacterium]